VATKQEKDAARRRPALKRLFGLALALLPGPASAELVYRNAFKLDAEYEMDRFMGDLPWDWRDRFAAAPTGFQVTGGSLNIRHIVLDQRLKVRFPFSERWAFRFRHDRRLGLERQDVETQVEFEYGPRRNLFFSLIGEPTFHKSDALAGFAARWGLEEGRSVKFAYLWPGFDANYAFENQSVNEGYEEFYRRAPQEARLSAAWIAGPGSLLLEARRRRPSELARRDFPGTTQAVTREESSEARLDARWRRGEWTAALEGEVWNAREEALTEPAAASDAEVVAERSAARLSLERTLGAAWRARIGGGDARLRGGRRQLSAPGADEYYRLHDRPWFLLVYHSFSPRFSMDGGFLYDRQTISSLETGQVPVVEPRSQSRAKVALQRDFENGASIRAAAAVELDLNQEETFASFDGATIQFQTTFQ
jgi:hypothetical protein